MIHTHLEHAPLIEALLEIQVPLGVDYTFVPGALAQRLGVEFPLAEKVNALQIGTVAVPMLGPNTSNVRLRSRDGSRIVQCGPQVVTVNMVAPYPGFRVFEKTMRVALDVFYEVARPQRPQRIGLRYINLISPSVLTDAPLEVAAAFPAILPPKKAYAMRAVFPYADAQGELAIAAGDGQTLNDGRTGFMLDLEFYSENPEISDLGGILAWADNAHDIIYNAFDACAGKKLLAKFR